MLTHDEILTLAIETSNPSLVTSGTAPAMTGSTPSPTPSPMTGSTPGAGPGVVVGLAGREGARVLAWRALERAHPNEDPLAAMIDACVRDAGIRPSDLRRVAVSIGPGGFTSVRVAVTTAKTIAEATGAACVGVPSALVAAWGLRAGDLNAQNAAGSTSAARFPAAIAMASKGESAWIAVYGPDLVPRGEARVMTAQDVGKLVREGVRTLARDAFLPREMEAAAMESGLECTELRLSARGVLELSASIDAVDPAALAPIYPREPEAVTKWRAMGRGSDRAAGPERR